MPESLPLQVPHCWQGHCHLPEPFPTNHTSPLGGRSDPGAGGGESRRCGGGSGLVWTQEGRGSW